MDLFLPIVLFIVFCVLFSICGWCCKKHREGTVYGYAGQPNVTVTTQPASAVIPPYPVQDTRVPQPQVVPPPGFAHTGYQTAPYPTATTAYPPPPGGGYPPATPYPVTVSATPYPATQSTPYPPTSAAPYPPASGAPYPPAQPMPPSYHEAMGQPPPAEPHPVHEAYSKQAPYNPHY